MPDSTRDYSEQGAGNRIPMQTRYFFSLVLVAVLCSWSILFNAAAPGAEAQQQGEIITKQKTIQRSFNETNPDGKVDLKKIVEEELVKPEECEQALVICQIKEVGFDITIKKKWLKLNITQLNSYDFANSVSPIKNPVDQLNKQETVILQEVLARRGLLQNRDGSVVKDRGFLGSLTKLGLVRLAQIKSLNPKDPHFNEQLRDKVNELLSKMSKDGDYLINHALPKREQMEPKAGDPLYDLWKQQQYLSDLAQKGERVDAGAIPVNGNVDVNIDGFVDVKRVKNP